MYYYRNATRSAAEATRTKNLKSGPYLSCLSLHPIRDRGCERCHSDATSGTGRFRHTRIQLMNDSEDVDRWRREWEKKVQCESFDWGCSSCML